MLTLSASRSLNWLVKLAISRLVHLRNAEVQMNVMQMWCNFIGQLPVFYTIYVFKPNPHIFSAVPRSIYDHNNIQPSTTTASTSSTTPSTTSTPSIYTYETCKSILNSSALQSLSSEGGMSPTSRASNARSAPLKIHYLRRSI